MIDRKHLIVATLLHVCITTMLVLCASTIQAQDNAAGSDWPHWLGPDSTGISPERGWSAEKPKVVWTTDIGVGFSSMAVVGDRVYAMGNKHQNDRDSDFDTVYCLDTGMGKKIWTFTYPARRVANLHEGGPSATPTVHDGRVYTLGKAGQLHCLSADKGEVLWQADLLKLLEMDKEPVWGFTSSGVIVGENIVFQAGPTIALDRKTGKVAWKSKSAKPAYSTPALFESQGKGRLAVLNTGGLVILDVGNGEEISRYPWKTSFDTNSTTPIVIGESVFLSTGYEKGCALLKMQSGEMGVIYRNKHMSNHMNNSVLIGDHLYGFDGNSHRSALVKLVCIEAKTGQEKWRQEGLGCGSLIASDGKLIVLSDKGELVIAPASPEKFESISRTPVVKGKCWTSPVLSHGRIYCRSNDTGQLVCIDVRP